MPPALGLEGPALLLSPQYFIRQIFPGHVGDVFSELRPADRYYVGHERSEEPFLLVASAGARVEGAEIAELLPNLDAERDAAVPQHLAGLPLVDLGVHVQRGKQRIEGRGRR